MVSSRRTLIQIECVMNITELYDRSARLEAELRETRELLARATHDPGALAEELAQTRTYAFSAKADPMETAISGCADSLRRYGYCVIDNVIPGEEVETIRDEIVAADVRIKGNIAAINAFFEDKPELDAQPALDLAQANGLELRSVRRAGHPPKPPNDIVWMPSYAQHLTHPAVTGIACRILDDHLRIAQLHTRIIATDGDGTPGGFGSAEHRGPRRQPGVAHRLAPRPVGLR